MESVRLGLIGMGAIGTPHVSILKTVEECQLVAISDVQEKHRAEAASLGVNFYQDYEEMLKKENLHGVIIATPNHLHAAMGIACARHGLHLFVEKPIAPSLSEADQLIAAAKQNNVRILVGHHRRFNAVVEKAREVVRGGELGRLIGATVTWALLKPPEYFEGSSAWRKNQGGGPILINLIHDIDNLRYICGEVTEVFSVASNKIRNFTVEDTAAVTFRFESGAVGTAFVSDCAPSVTGYDAATGENPAFYRDFANCYQFFGTEASLLFPQLKKLFYADGAKLGWHHPITEQGLKVTREDDPYVKQFRHFARVVRGEAAPRITGEDGRRTLEVTLAVRRSAESGQPIHLD